MYRVLEITTTTGCAVGCAYCPQRRFARAQKRVSRSHKLSLSSFRQCLSTVPADVDISFAGYSEPWLNRDCTTMVEHACAKGHGIRVFSTLVGMRFSDVNRLRHLPINLFVVHLFDDGTYMNPRYVTAEYRRLLQCVIESAIPSLKFLVFGALHPDLEGTVPAAAIVRTRPLLSRAGNVDSAIVPLRTSLVGAIECAEGREYRNVLLPNGDVTLCCMDYERRHVIGNLLLNDYADLHAGEAFQEILRRLAGESGSLICRMCENAKPQMSPL